jgi:hypothetical protein
MSEPKEGASWWQTIPGILTGVAAVITAVGGIFAAIHQSGIFAGKRSPATPPAASAETHSTSSAVIASNDSHSSSNTDSLPAQVAQVHVGHYVFKLLGSTLEPYSSDVNSKPSKFTLRLSIRVTDVGGISDYVDRRTIRLSADGAELIPENAINFAVYDKQYVDTEALFIIPSDAAKVELLLGRPGDATGRIPLTLPLH